MTELKIEIKELVGNAFISYLEKTDKREILLKKVEDFGNSVIEDLKKHKTEAILSLSEDQINDFFDLYSEWFSYENENLIILKDEISRTDLIKEFAGYLSIPVLAAFRNERNIERLL